MIVVVITTPSLVPHDAVSNDVLIQHEQLTKHGYQVYLYAEMIHDSIPEHLVISRKLAESFVEESQNIFIYHHSVGWQIGMDLLKKSKCYTLLKYHNITPSNFFEPYDRSVVKATSQGRRQTRDIVALDKVHRYTADSAYNASELHDMGVMPEDVKVIPPYTKIHEFHEAEVNTELLPTLVGGRKNILFVGRVVPNKGHKHLIRTLDSYLSHYGEKIHLHIVGGFFSNRKFIKELESLINELAVSEYLTFHSKTNFQDLHTLYACAHAFLVMSEHEGFCVPILEAQLHQVPVIALAQDAVRDTAGSEALVFEQPNYELFATAIHKVFNDNDLRDYLVEAGKDNLQRFSTESITERMISAIQRA